MKKTLIALAAVAVSSAAMAQVTISGRVDAAFGTDKTTTNTNGTITTDDDGIQMFRNGMMTSSRLNFSGSEDLGNGMKAFFTLEERFSLDEAQASSPTRFAGDAFVGLSGGFGSVILGVDASALAPADDVAGTVFDGTFGTSGMPGKATGSSTNNQIKYTSPSFSGVTVAVSQGLKEDKTAGAKNTDSFSLVYSAGPLTAAYGQQSTAAADYTTFTAAYDLGVAKIVAGQGTNKLVNNGNETSGYDLGVSVPMGAITLAVGYGSNEVKLVGVKVSDMTNFSAAISYSLSKRSSLYAGIENKETKTVSTKVTVDQKVFAVGMRHNF